MAIIGIAGGKRAGKDSAARFISGLVMHKVGLIQKYDMDDEGRLIVNYEVNNGNSVSRGMGVFDLDRRDESFMSYMNEMVWPHVKIYHFADALKFILANMFSLDINKLFGSGEEKEEQTHISWGKMVDVIPSKKLKKGIKLDDKMTYRQVMQHAGDIFRNIDDLCFVNYLLAQINAEQCPLAVVADIRREEEVDAINAVGGKVIYLSRRVDDTETHDIESALVNVDKNKFYFTVDNQDMTIAEKNVRIMNELKDRGFLE